MESLIGVINEVQDALSPLEVAARPDLPRIVVVGSQSAGKSSVLECIVGRDFLPRGSGIVTRVPLLLHLHQLPSSEKREWGEFEHLPGKKIDNFDEIRMEIIRQTNVVAGPVSIANKPIKLSLFSRHHLELSIVDLPGLVMNATVGQPKDIDVQIRNMVTEFISPSATIILAICPANTDIAANQALEFCRKYDPKGERTVGVITKIDLMDRGTDCLKVLKNVEYPLQHGYVGVVCRSQQSINDNVPMEVAKKEERDFFSNSPVYCSVAGQCGIDFLRKKLSLLLMQHIRQSLPKLKKDIDEKYETNLKLMESLGMLDAANLDPGAQILSGIKSFSDEVQKTIKGGVSAEEINIVGGARIQVIIAEWFSRQIKNVSLHKKLTDEIILANMRNMAGIHSSVFPSDAVIFSLVRTNILSLTKPCLFCVKVIVDEMQNIVVLSANSVKNFPNLQQEVIRISSGLLEECNKTIISHINTIVKAESEYINVHNPRIQALAEELFAKPLPNPAREEDKAPVSDSEAEKSSHENDAKDKKNRGKDEKGKEGDKKDEKERRKEEEERKQEEERGGKKKSKGNFISFGGPFGKERGGMEDNIEAVPLSMAISPDWATGSEKRSFDVVRRMVIEYFNVAKEMIADQAGKAILFLVVSHFCEEVYSRLIRELYSHEKINDLAKEPPGQAEQRRKAAAMAKAISKAREVLNSADFKMGER